MANSNARWAGYAALKLAGTNKCSLRCELSRTGTLTVFLGLQRLAVLISSGAEGFLLFRQTADGLKLTADQYATITAVLAALLSEVPV